MQTPFGGRGGRGLRDKVVLMIPYHLAKGGSSSSSSQDEDEDDQQQFDRPSS